MRRLRLSRQRSVLGERRTTQRLLAVVIARLTKALGVYESVGMRPVLVIDVWRRVVATS